MRIGPAGFLLLAALPARSADPGAAGRVLIFASGRYCIHEVQGTAEEVPPDRAGEPVGYRYPARDAGRVDPEHPLALALAPGRHQLVAVADDVVRGPPSSAAQRLPAYPEWGLADDELRRRREAGEPIRQGPAVFASACRGRGTVHLLIVDDSAPTLLFLGAASRPAVAARSRAPLRRWLDEDRWTRDWRAARVVAGEVDDGCATPEACARPRAKLEIRREFWMMTTEATTGLLRRHALLQTTEDPPPLPGTIAPALFAGAAPLPPGLEQAPLWLPDDYPALAVTPDLARRACRWLGGRVPAAGEWRLAALADGPEAWGAPLGAGGTLCARGNVLDDGRDPGCREWLDRKREWEAMSAAGDVPTLGPDDLANPLRVELARRAWLGYGNAIPPPVWSSPLSEPAGERVRDEYCANGARPDSLFCADWMRRKRAWEREAGAGPAGESAAEFAVRRRAFLARAETDGRAARWRETFGPLDPATRDALCDCRDGFAGPAPVGRFAANPLGFQDLIGNVAEWVTGARGPDPLDRGDPAALPAGVAGGHWRNGPLGQRLDGPPAAAASASPTAGFRCVFDRDPGKPAAAP